MESRENSASRASEPSSAPSTCDIFNTTFGMYRVSPLFLGSVGLSDSRLRILEQRLRDVLVGDVVRGVEVGLDGSSNAGMESAGALESVAIELVPLDGLLNTHEKALQITITYENSNCHGILLPFPKSPQASKLVNSHTTLTKDSLHLPLLLLRMPTILKTVVTGFLSDNFDCHISSMRLSSADITRSWETWARETGFPISGPLAKDAVLTLTINLPKQGHDRGAGPARTASDISPDDSSISMSCGLKTIDIFIPNDDLRGFLKVGQRQKHSLDANKTPGPFTVALSRYVRQHLALDLASPAIAISRIACGGFVIAEPRVKLFGVPAASMDIYAERHRIAIARVLEDIVLRAAE